MNPRAATSLDLLHLAAAWVKFPALAGFLLLAMNASGQNPNSIINSKHNLSTSGHGTVRSSTESEVCVFCHAPHNATGDGPRHRANGIYTIHFRSSPSAKSRCSSMALEAA